MSNTSWSPGEDSATIFSEDTWLQGALLMCIAYGAVATLSIQCFFMLVRRINPSRRWRDGLLLAFVFLIFSLSTVFTATTMRFTQQAFIDDRSYPGGPSAYEVMEFSIPVDAAANDALVVSTFLSDALLLWRCTVIYGNSSAPRWITFGLAGLFWLTELIIGILFLVELTTTSIFGTVNLTLGFWCFSLALNILATILIVTRLLYYRYQLASVLGNTLSIQYTGIIAMIVESELLYSTFLILYIVPFVLNNSLVNVFVQPPSLVQAVSALMIVYRVADGKGWSNDTFAQITTSTADSGLRRHTSTLGVVRSEIAFTSEDATKSVGPEVEVMQEIYVAKDTSAVVEEV